MHQQSNFQIKALLSRRFQSHLVIYNRWFLQCSWGYVFHHCTWDSGVRNKKSKPQLQIGFDVPENCLNLGSHKWLRSARILLATFIPLWFSQLKALLGVALIMIIWKETEEIHFYKICKSSKTFWTGGEFEGTLEVVHRKTKP